MLFSAAVVLSAFAPALAGPLVRGGIYPRGNDHKLYARAGVKSQDGSIWAQFEFEGYKTGDPTWIKVHDIKGLSTDPRLGGPFLYHIHTNPVPDDGNCTKTLAHLDPLSVTEGFICNPAFPQYCQTGDFSGKHGKLNGTDDGYVPSVEYSDAYVRFFPKSHSLLGRSIVIHSSNKTRLACGNIISQLDGTANDNFEPTGKPSEYVTDYPTTVPVPPGPAVIISNGTEAPDQSSLPYPLPEPAYPLWEAVNVKLTTITRTVETSSGQQTVTQPKEKKVAGTGPFGSW